MSKDRGSAEIEAYLDDLSAYVDKRAEALGSEPTTVLIVADPKGGFAMRARNAVDLAFVQLLLGVALDRSKCEVPQLTIRADKTSKVDA